MSHGVIKEIFYNPMETYSREDGNYFFLTHFGVEKDYRVNRIHNTNEMQTRIYLINSETHIMFLD